MTKYKSSAASLRRSKKGGQSPPINIIHTVAGNTVSGLSGDEGPATRASLNGPRGVAVDQSGDLLIADSRNNRLRRVRKGTGIITTATGGLNNPVQVAVAPISGNIFIADRNHESIRRLNPTTGEMITMNATVNKKPYGVDVTEDGESIIVTFGEDHSPNDNFLQVPTNPSVQPRNIGYGAGWIQYNRRRNQQPFPARASAVAIWYTNPPSSGDYEIFFADPEKHRILRRHSSNDDTTIVAGVSSWQRYSALEEIQVFESGFTGDGGLARNARLNRPEGIAVNPNIGGGVLYIADSGNHRIRRIDLGTGIITTVAGNGVAGFSGDWENALSASLNYPTGLAVDKRTGNLIIADTNNNCIRLLAPAPAEINTSLNDIKDLTRLGLTKDSNNDAMNRALKKFKDLTTTHYYGSDYFRPDTADEELAKIRRHIIDLFNTGLRPNSNNETFNNLLKRYKEITKTDFAFAPDAPEILLAKIEDEIKYLTSMGITENDNNEAMKSALTKYRELKGSPYVFPAVPPEEELSRLRSDLESFTSQGLNPDSNGAVKRVLDRYRELTGSDYVPANYVPGSPVLRGTELYQIISDIEYLTSEGIGTDSDNEKMKETLNRYREITNSEYVPTIKGGRRRKNKKSRSLRKSIALRKSRALRKNKN